MKHGKCTPMSTTLMALQTKRKLIGVDCDGTLFDSNSYPSEKTCEVAHRLSAAGHQIVAVTGRSRHSVNERLCQLPSLQYVVCSNGAYAWDRRIGKITWETVINKSVVEEIMMLLRAEYTDVSFGWETPGGIGFETEFTKLAGGADQLEFVGNAKTIGEQGLYKLYVRRPDIHGVALQKDLLAILGNSRGEISTSGVPFIEITAVGSDKASGLEKIAQQLGFTAADTIVFGDNHNDLPMFRWAGHAVAMGNADKMIKAKANAIALNNHEHGVACYLENLLDSGEL